MFWSSVRGALVFWPCVLLVILGVTFCWCPLGEILFEQAERLMDWSV